MVVPAKVNPEHVALNRQTERRLQGALDLDPRLREGDGILYQSQ
ncbi:hypothetical protein GCM10007082_09600 [Oceanisphaera arctica]|nr:hypothetical protein GCM10007082_09600 [Oceanisphaera arctica]